LVGWYGIKKRRKGGGGWGGGGGEGGKLRYWAAGFKKKILKNVLIMKNYIQKNV
jgi:hypothetical protein